MKRSLTTNDPNDTQFRSGQSVPIAFAVWDGQNVERNGQKGISTWFTAKMP
ncbi:MAG: ethylbenzene dehydrogenase-related protein [Nitrospirales bacterium]